MTQRRQATDLRLVTYELDSQRTSDTDFAPADAGKVIAYVQETDVHWQLVSVSPSISWSAIGSATPAGSVGTAELEDGAVTADKLGAGAATDAKIASLGSTRALGGRDEGQACVGYFYLTSTAADTELVTINSRTYEFDTDSTSTGDVAVDINADQTADAACTALAAAVNGDSSRDVDAVVMAGNADTNAGVMFVATAAGATNFTLTTDASNGVVSAANLTGASAAANNSVWTSEYTVTAADVTQLATTGGNSVPILGVTSTTAPKLTGCVLRTSAGAFRPFLATMALTWLQANSNFWVLVLDDSGGDIAAGDVIGTTVVVG